MRQNQIDNMSKKPVNGKKTGDVFLTVCGLILIAITCWYLFTLVR